MALRIFSRRPRSDTTDAVYRLIVAQARQPAFYTGCDVPDTPDGRFDMVVLHAILILRRLHDDLSFSDEAQALFDLLFVDMDENLREMGVGDLAVGKRVKGMAKGFYGRLAAYDAALKDPDAAPLTAALLRNVYRHGTPRDGALAALTAYVRREAAALDAVPVDAVGRAGFRFGPPPDGNVGEEGAS